MPNAINMTMATTTATAISVLLRVLIQSLKHHANDFVAVTGCDQELNKSELRGLFSPRNTRTTRKITTKGTKRRALAVDDADGRGLRWEIFIAKA